MIQTWNASNLQQNKLVPDLRFLYSINSKATTKLNKAINRILLTKMVYRIWPGDRFRNTQRHNHTHSVAENGVSDMARRQVSEHTKTQSHTLSRRKRCIGYGPETDFGTHKDTITHTQSQKTVYRIWPGDRFRNTQRHHHTRTVAENSVSDMARRQVSEHTKTNSHTHSRRKRCIGYGPETGFGTHKDTITHAQSQKTVYWIWPGDRFRNTQRQIHTHTVAENGVSDMARRQVSERTKTNSHTHSRRKQCIGYGPETGFGTHKDKFTHTQSQKTVYRIWPGDRFRNTQCTISQSQKKVMAISLMFNCAILPITTNFKLLDYLRPYPISRCKIYGKRPYPISRCKIHGSFLFYIAYYQFKAS